MATNLTDVPPDRRCGAKTRDGDPCKNWGRHPSGRCRMHGGKSRGGMASPSLKHGWYSTYFPYTMYRQQIRTSERIERMVQALRDDDPMHR